MTLTELTTRVRNLTGIFSTDVVSDALIYDWLNEAYQEVARAKDWDWLEQEYSAGLSPWSTSFTAFSQTGNTVSLTVAKGHGLVAGQAVTISHSNTSAPYVSMVGKFNVAGVVVGVGATDDITFTSPVSDTVSSALSGTITAEDHRIALANGTRRVQEVFLVEPNGHVREVLQVPQIADVEPNDNRPVYDVSFSGVVKIAPEQKNLPLTVKVRYLVANVNMNTASPTTSSPVFDSQFHVALAYRAAVKVLAFVSDDTNRSDFYMQEYAALLDGMVTLYELDHGTTTFQIGQRGVDEPVYRPWFRPA